MRTSTAICTYKKPRFDFSYLIETDHRFTDYKSYTSSDYLLSRLSMDPSMAQKRLGDGFYEQKLISLTASRDISNISGSISGRRVSLSAGNNLLNSTASMSIGNRATGSEQNSSTGANGLGSFIPVDTGQASAYNTLIGNQGSITASDTLSLEAGNTLSILGASLSSGGNAQLKAGNQLIVNTLTTQSGITSGGPYKNDSAQTQNIRSSISAGNNLSLNSGGDMQLTAANLSAGRSASLISGGNLTLDTAKDITSHNQSAGRNINQAYDETVLGTNLKAGGNITLAATNVAPVGVASATNGTSKGNINLMSANLTSDTGKLTIIADNNINIGTTAEKHTSLIQTYRESSGFMSSSSSTNRTATSQTYAIGSSLSADSINIKSGKDINITGSSIAATNDVMLDAGNNLNILAATSYNSTSSYSHTTSSGFMSNGGLSITYGNRESTDKFDSSNTLQSQNRSMVGSINGNLILKAKGNALISGSDILAGQDINVLASDITINSGRDQSTNTEQHKFSQSGLTIALSNPVINAVQTGQQMQQAAKQTTDKRIQALAAVNVALAANSAYDAVSQNPSQAGGIKVSVSIGSSSSESRSTQTSDKAIGSTVKAGGNLNLVATAGKGEEGGGNITIQGSDIKAGNNISLAADNTINLLADQSTASQTSSNNSSSASIGLSFGVGKSGAGLSLDIAASRARGNADGNDIGNTNTHLSAGNQLSIKSGGDTNLKGAVANGKQIIADIGGNLTIESLQDKSTYQGKQESAGFSASIPIMGTGGGGSLSASQSNINSNYASVTEQSGFKAGDGGFQVAVKGNTTLTGGVIAASDTAITDQKNTFDTATLITSDIQNKAEASANSIGVNLSSDMMSQGKYGMAKGVIGNLLNNASESGSSNGQTLSAVSAGTVTITNEAQQKALTGKGAQETVASLNRDTINAQTVAQKQDVQVMAQTVEAERTIKAEAIKQVTAVTDLVYKQQTADKKVILQTCDEGGQSCKQLIVKPEDAKVGDNNRINVFNNGIGNNEQETLANAAKQSSDDANAQGVYVVVNPPTGNPLAELLTATWDKTLAPVFGISNASEANIDVMNAAAQQGGVVDSVNHSRGTLTESNALIAASERNPLGTLPIGNIQLNGSAANAQNMANLVNTMTNGSGLVMQSTHVSDIVGAMIGGNAPTGGMTLRTDTNDGMLTTRVIDLNPQGAGGVPMWFGDAHSSYVGNLSPEFNAAGNKNQVRLLTNQAWGIGAINTPVVVAPTNNVGRRQ